MAMRRRGSTPAPNVFRSALHPYNFGYKFRPGVALDAYTTTVRYERIVRREQLLTRQKQM